jgi:endonuclease-3
MKKIENRKTFLHTKKKILDIYKTLDLLYPEAVIELDFSNNYQLLIAVVLSAQATDKSVNKVTKNFFSFVKTPEDLIALPQEKIESLIKTIGLWRAKAKNLRLLSEKLVTQFESKVPDNLIDLESLPGVGRKTASVVLNTAFNQPIIAVDTHVYRVSQRLSLAPKNISFDKVADHLNAATPQDYLKSAHHLLIYHGRYLCKARHPLCHMCVLMPYCTFDEKNMSKK